MIIGNNNSFNNNNNSFQKKMSNNTNNNTSINNEIKEETKKEKKGFKNIFTKNIFNMGSSNINNEDAMYEKSIALLNDRLEKGTITIDEFNKKCSELAKKRNKF